MSDFQVKIRTIDEVSDHPNADRLSLNKILGYTAISNKDENGNHRYHPGDMVVYVPEGAVVPEWALRRYGYWNEEKGIGMLAGSKGDRVKAITLRGILSQGLILPTRQQDIWEKDCCVEGPDGVTKCFGLGEDVAEFLGISKYVPPIPINMAGEVYPCDGFYNYDIENIQSVPDMFEWPSLVQVTEKLHGTFCQIILTDVQHPDAGQSYDSAYLHVSSKGLSAKGLALRNNDANANNLYIRTLRKLIYGTKLLDGFARLAWDNRVIRGDYLCEEFPIVRIFGEIYGKGVQDLDYGEAEPQFRVFDIMVGQEWLKWPPETIMREFGLESVPVLACGEMTLADIEKLRDGKCYSGKHIREGVVIRGEGRHPYHGRRIAKMISPAYLTRKGGTEFN